MAVIGPHEHRPADRGRRADRAAVRRHGVRDRSVRCVQFVQVPVVGPHVELATRQRRRGADDRSGRGGPHQVSRRAVDRVHVAVLRADVHDPVCDCRRVERAVSRVVPQHPPGRLVERVQVSVVIGADVDVAVGSDG